MDEGPEMLTTGFGFTWMEIVAVDEQPEPLNPLTVYTVVDEGFTITCGRVEDIGDQL